MAPYTQVPAIALRNDIAKHISSVTGFSLKVPKAGLEPACLATHAPETCVSTNSTTSAKSVISFRYPVMAFERKDAIEN